jgi:hypothetical protein
VPSRDCRAQAASEYWLHEGSFAIEVPLLHLNREISQQTEEIANGMKLASYKSRHPLIVAEENARRWLSGTGISAKGGTAYGDASRRIEK